MRLAHTLLLLGAFALAGCGGGDLDDGMLNDLRALATQMGAYGGGPKGPAGVGKKCDYSYGTSRCSKGAFCDPGSHTMVKMKDGRTGIVGRCTAYKSVGMPCSLNSHCITGRCEAPKDGEKRCLSVVPEDDGSGSDAATAGEGSAG